MSERAFEAGWGGVVWKTLGEEGPPVVNVNGPRYGAIWGADRRLLGLNNIELITDRPLEVNLREIKQVKRDYGPRADHLADGALRRGQLEGHPAAHRGYRRDGVELNFGCPHGMASAAWARPSGRCRNISRWSRAGQAIHAHAGAS
jgi:dihydropyrimidine dehydrogenase (NAD+) subunit PreA